MRTHTLRLCASIVSLAVFAISAISPASAQTGGSHVFTNQVITTDTTPNNFDINSFLGANTFYNAGYTGTNAIAANIEGGYFWNGHQALSTNTVLLPVGGTGSAMGSGQYDGHPTEVASALAGRPLFPGDARAGIAYGATLWGGAVATQIQGLSFNVSDASFFTPYATALLTGYNGRKADVTNSSFTYSDPPPSSDPNNSGTGSNVTGADPYTVALDGIAAQSGKTMVYAAGNSGQGTNKVGDPAGGYNGISVGAVTYGNASTPYTNLSGYSSGGPSDFQGPVNPSTPGGSVTQSQFVANARARVDIVAPGDPLSLAEYGSDSTAYTGAVGGTSFAAPIVAGAATLLCDVGNSRYQGNSTQGNVIKAVLLNSADYRDMVGYNNGQTLVNGVVTTTQALDYNYGAGRLDLDKAFTQYTGGITDVSGLIGASNLASVGWDYGAVGKNGFNDYAFNGPLAAGSTFSATLNWYVDRTYAGLTDDGLLNTNPILDANGYLIADPHDLAFVNLDLDLFMVNSDDSLTLVAESKAGYINTQHFNYDITQTGNYVLRVAWAGELYDVNGNVMNQTYGLAWSGAAVPEPGSVVFMLIGVSGFAFLSAQDKESRPYRRACVSAKGTYLTPRTTRRTQWRNAFHFRECQTRDWRESC